MLKQKPCRYCKQLFQPKTAKHIVCSADCAIGLQEKQASKQLHTQARMQRKELREKKLALKRRGDWIKDAQKAFNNFIRLRDANLGCISCGAFLNPDIAGGGFDAGHYLSRGAKPHLRFDERNVHGQCKRCNRYLSGNVANYRVGLIKRIGLEQLNALEAENTQKHYSIDDIKNIIETYKQKCRELERKAA